MRTPDTRRDGFAMPVALFALVVVGVLVTGGFFMARQESRIGMADTQSNRAFYLAERGALEVMSSGGALQAYGSLGAWTDTTVSDTLDNGYYDVRVTSMGNRMFFLASQGTVTEGGGMYSGATRRVGMIARIYSATIDPPAALTTQGQLKVGGSSQIVGNDSIPTGWDAVCDTADLTDKPGIMINDEDSVTTSGNNYEIAGSPQVAEDTTLTSTNLLQFGDMSFEDLAALATYEYTSSKESVTQIDVDSMSVGGNWECDTSSDRSWGDPENPGSACSNHFPIIYAHNDIDIQSSDSGQGILLIGGDLKLQGGFTFYGPVIVRGTLTTAGTGGHVQGGVIAANVNLDASSVLGNALVQYSTCGVTRAILNNPNLSRLRPMVARSWVDLSNITS